MLSLNILLTILLSVFFPTMFSSASIAGDTLTLQLPASKVQAAYGATFDAGGVVKARGLMTMEGTPRDATSDFQKASIDSPETRPVSFPFQRIQLDEKFRPVSPDVESPCVDLFALFGADKISLVQGKPAKFDFTWRKSRLQGTVTFKGNVDGKLVVETTGNITVEKTKFKLRSTLRYDAAGGSPVNLSAELADKDRTLKWEFTDSKAKTSDKGKI